MKPPWDQRFFAKNKEVEVELAETTISILLRAVGNLNWLLDDSFWAPNLQVSRYIKGDHELFVILETYFGPKLTGELSDIEEVRTAISRIDPNEELFAGKKT